jgi:hypothetical protein
MDSELERLSEALYDRYGKPLESEHWGEFVAISREGRFVLASTRRDALQKATDELGMGSFVFKVGERSVGKWR